MLDQMPNRVHSHPAYSPDLNPIENLGNSLKRKMNERLKTLGHQSHSQIAELTSLLWREFDNDLDYLHHLVDSMHRRYNDCITAMGEATKY